MFRRNVRGYKFTISPTSRFNFGEFTWYFPVFWCYRSLPRRRSKVGEWSISDVTKRKFKNLRDQSYHTDCSGWHTTFPGKIRCDSNEQGCPKKEQSKSDIDLVPSVSLPRRWNWSTVDRYQDWIRKIVRWKLSCKVCFIDCCNPGDLGHTIRTETCTVIEQWATCFQPVKLLKSDYRK